MGKVFSQCLLFLLVVFSTSVMGIMVVKAQQPSCFSPIKIPIPNSVICNTICGSRCNPTYPVYHCKSVDSTVPWQRCSCCRN